MSAAEPTHSPTPEEVMAYLDGEETMMSRGAMEAHLAACETCRDVAAGLRGVSGRAAKWTVAEAPASLQPPRAGRRTGLLIPFASWRPSRVAMAGLGTAAAAVIVIAVGVQSARKPPVMAMIAPRHVTATAEGVERRGGLANQPPSEAPPVAGKSAYMGQLPTPAEAAAAQAAAPRGPMVIRTATLRIVVKAFGNVRPTVEAVVSQFAGFVDRLTVNGDSATARSLTGSLRVPSDRMSAALDRLRQIGQVVEDAQGSEDVTDQIVDLDARLASARATEQRLTDLLKNRTGRLSDVLSVERELARVRLDIERLDAEKTNTTRRVTYATIAIEISEERKQGLDTGALPLSTRIRVAAADGAAAALESLVSTGLFLLRAGPSLLLWGLAAAAAWLAFRRKLRALASGSGL